MKNDLVLHLPVVRFDPLYFSLWRVDCNIMRGKRKAMPPTVRLVISSFALVFTAVFDLWRVC